MDCNTSIIEWFSNECCTTKTKVTNLANHRGHRQSNEPINTRYKYMYLTRSAGKHVRAIHDSYWMKE